MSKSIESAFRFKRFTIQQPQSAMKVGFDGVLLGAWTDVVGCQRVLDIGTGTGLVALMLAQRTESMTPLPRLDAVELDAGAAQEAEHNVARSPWGDRVRIFRQEVEAFATSCDTRYDLIVCNPPFHSGPLSANAARTQARHDDSLSADTLLAVASTLLTDDGRLSLIYPFDRRETIIDMAALFGLTLASELQVQPRPDKPFHRTLQQFQRGTASAIASSARLAIELDRHRYSDTFRQLLEPFYLAF